MSGQRRLLSFIIAFALCTPPLWAGFTGTEVFLPAVGRVTGAGGAEFYTTVWLTNPSAAEHVTATIRFLRRGGPNLTAQATTISLDPGETRLFENITETLFNAPGVLGALRVTSTADVLVSSRIYNQSPGAPVKNTQGLFFGGVPASLALRAGESALIQGVRQSDDFRYNFFAVETTGQQAVMRIKIRDAHGAVIAERDYTLGGYEQMLAAVTDIQPGFTTSNAMLEASVVGGSGQVIVAGSQTANESQDGSGFEMAFRPLAAINAFSLNGLSGNVTLSAGPNVTITPSGSTLTIAAAGSISGVSATAGLTGGGTSGNVTVGIAAGGVTSDKIAAGQVVKSINGITDDLVLNAGSGVSISQTAPRTLTISSSGGGGGPSGPAGGVLTGNYPAPDFANGQVVRYIKVGTTAFTDGMQIAAGENISLAPSGATLTINGTGVAHDGTLDGAGTGASPLRIRTPLLLSDAGFGIPLTVTGSTAANIRAINTGGGVGVDAYAPAYFGLFGETTSGAGICGSVRTGGSGLAGSFFGNVSIAGTLSKSAGSFRIDHPLDPENKYLSHSFVESPDMMNIYNGNVVLDGRGEATIEMPEWFSALNRDFRYQLTALGAPSPNLYVADEIADNRFRVAGGAPGAKVSWQVTGIRHDRYADAHRIPVEETKPDSERGFYLAPDVYGMPPERRIGPKSIH